MVVQINLIYRPDIVQETASGSLFSTMARSKQQCSQIRRILRPSATAPEWSGHRPVASHSGARKLRPSLTRHLTTPKGQRHNTQNEKEIRRLRDTDKPAIPKGPFDRMVRELTRDLLVDLKWSTNAMAALHEASEDHIVTVMGHANEAARSNGRKTITKKDFELVKDLA